MKRTSLSLFGAAALIAATSLLSAATVQAGVLNDPGIDQAVDLTSESDVLQVMVLTAESYDVVTVRLIADTVDVWALDLTADTVDVRSAINQTFNSKYIIARSAPRPWSNTRLIC